MANPKNNLSDISNLLNSLKEVKSYIITDMDGGIHMASSEKYNENTINSCIYLWVTGSQLGGEFNMGRPANLVYYMKNKKMLVQRYGDYLIILNLIDIAKFAAFKKKLYELFNRIM
jgi:predicted regulator of Ras-like GTPase activity (Roadblock/LC7/MglB family)